MTFFYLFRYLFLLNCVCVVFNRQPSPTKADGAAGGGAGGAGAGGKRAGQTSATAAAAAGKGKGAATGGTTGKGGTKSGRPGTGKAASEKAIDTNKPHWILRIVSDADKAVRIFLF